MGTRHLLGIGLGLALAWGSGTGYAQAPLTGLTGIRAEGMASAELTLVQVASPTIYNSLGALYNSMSQIKQYDKNRRELQSDGKNSKKPPPKMTPKRTPPLDVLNRPSG